MYVKTKFSTIIFLLCILFQNSFSQQNYNGWYWLNGKPQSNTLNWMKFINQSTVYAVGDNGTFMKSTDGGDSWVINSQAGPLNSYNSPGSPTRNLKTAHFFDANTGLVGGSSIDQFGDAIGRTTDGGKTFQKISLGLESHSVNKFFFLNSTTGYACGNSVTKLVKTTNAGLNWTAVPNVLNSSNYNSVYAFDVNKIIMVTTSGEVSSTTNGGATWNTFTIQGSSFIELTDIVFKDANTGYVSGNGSYFAYTTDSGVSWVQTGSPGTVGLYKLIISGNDVYTVGDFSNIYKTSNNGASWTAIDFLDNSNPYQPEQYFMYALDVSGSDIVVGGYEGAINYSNDGGVTWRNKNYCFSNSAVEFSAIWADSPNGKVWAGGTPGSMLYSTNGGTNWTVQATNSPYNLKNIEMLNSTTGFGITGSFSNAALIKTTNSGTNWFQIPLPSTYSNRSGIDMDFVDANTGWIVGGIMFQPGETMTCIKTTNGGVTWTQQQNNFSSNIVITCIDMVNANTGYYIAGGVGIFKTTNGGSNWNILNNVPVLSEGVYYTKVQAVSSSVAFLASTGGMVLKTTNGGASWNNLPAMSDPSSFFAMEWMDENNGLLGGTSGYLAKTSDGGVTWSTYNSGGSTIRNVSMRNRDTVFAVSDINGSWQIFKFNVPVATKLSMNFTAGIEGFWNGTSQVSDTINVTLRTQNSPYNVIDAGKAVLNNSGYATITFQNASSGNYYIQVNHRNSLETWSATPVYLGSNYNNYNFTTSASKSYGNNSVLKSGIYCIYSGDINQDETVDAGDLALVENSNGNSGYLPEDVNGDDFTDAGDVALVENNVGIGIFVIRP